MTWTRPTAELYPVGFANSYEQKDQAMSEQEDICGFCGMPGANKFPHPVRWPGENSAGTELVHAECEHEECRRAHSLLSDVQRANFLRCL